MNGSRKIIQTYTTELLLLLSIELIFPQITVMNLPESLTIAEESYWPWRFMPKSALAPLSSSA